MRRVRSTAAVFLLLVGAIRSAAEEPQGGTRSTLERLQAVIAARRQNLVDQDRAWPSRREDQLSELAPPAPVLRLMASHRDLDTDKARLTNRLEVESANDVGPLITALTATSDLDLAEVLVRVIAKLGSADERTVPALAGLAGRVTPCPRFLINALGEIGGAEAGSFLLKRGKEKKDVCILTAAGRGGEPAVLEEIIRLADTPEGVLSEACLKVVRGLTPPARRDRRSWEKAAGLTREETLAKDAGVASILRSEESSQRVRAAESLIATRITTVRLPELRTALITYLGLFKNPAHIPLLESLYAKESSDRARLAIVGALGNSGAAAGGFLLPKLMDERSALALRRSCIHALGSSGHRPAVRPLIECLDDPQVAREATRAMRRISRQDLGTRPGPWLRWWRAQPEAQGEPVDPDTIEVAQE